MELHKAALKMGLDAQASSAFEEIILARNRAASPSLARLLSSSFPRHTLFHANSPTDIRVLQVPIDFDGYVSYDMEGSWKL